ncbi:hypothetical protein GLAREA_04232 [Glarea lozoyensis ATCC 20868]|uniref:Uncharacterized protein n=1 Tax=Glarea lozoyensis (strain ATCC 20868 / MF5171) TaxID=1116229 RepID=S3D5R6_GLAL2|nr:uncharacterized protein GLAREA_04232 [Glarea lozoyensis ATCC 20868]EPE27441.1 hypothetical protein GLAREA_04232 [Glarea lozoyensis ATCC 20868]
MSAPLASRSEGKTEEQAVAAPSPTTSLPSSDTGPKWGDTLLFWFDWGIKVLGVAAAVVFGIWAPLSYQAANDASTSGDATQSSILQAALSANSQAASALSAQNSLAAKQSLALEDLNQRIGAIGQLWLLDFCVINTALAACKSFTSQVPIISLVSYLASPTTTFLTSTAGMTSTAVTVPTGTFPTTRPLTSTVTSRPSVTPNPGLGSSRPKATLSLPAILGIVFAVILFLGVIAGMFVSRFKRSRSRAYEESA